jgi:hypothetical protein
VIATALPSSPAARSEPSEALTPGSGSAGQLEDLLKELEAKSIQLSPDEQVVLIG